MKVCYSRTSTNGHLFKTATSVQRSFFIFLADSPYIHSYFNLSSMATSLQWPLSSVPKVAVVERFNCIKKVNLEKLTLSTQASQFFYFNSPLYKRTGPS